MNDQSIRAFLQGDSLAFREVYNSYWRLIYKIAIEYLHHPQEAEEAVQDIFVRLWKYRENIPDPSSLKGYLVKIAYSVLIRKLQKRKNNLLVELDERTSFADTTNDLFDLESLKSQAHVAIELLPEKRKKIFKMSREQEMSYEEIAQALGISRKTVENQMSTALKFLREKLPAYQYILVIIFFF